MEINLTEGEIAAGVVITVKGALHNCDVDPEDLEHPIWATDKDIESGKTRLEPDPPAGMFAAMDTDEAVSPAGDAPVDELLDGHTTRILKVVAANGDIKQKGSCLMMSDVAALGTSRILKIKYIADSRFYKIYDACRDLGLNVHP